MIYNNKPVMHDEKHDNIEKDFTVETLLICSYGVKTLMIITT